MANFTGKYMKVWKVETQNGYTKLDLGESQKKYNSENEYDNWTWFGCVLFGDAAKKEIKEGDKIQDNLKKQADLGNTFASEALEKEKEVERERTREIEKEKKVMISE